VEGDERDEREPTGSADPLAPLLGAGVEDLLQVLLGRVDELLSDQHRLRLLLDAVVVLAADLSLDRVLDRLVEVACELSGARYAALGVLDPGAERRLQAFITYGMSEEVRARIGELPRGRGLLGEIIDRPEPLRLHDIATHPSSFGFPEHHPPMSSFLGVPIRIRDQVFGNLYLTEKTGGGDFTARDEAVVVALAAAAGVVIENARLYEEAARRELWLAATAEVATVLSRSPEPEPALQLVADRARDLSRADVACVVLLRPQGRLQISAVSGADAASASTMLLSVEESLAGSVIAAGDPLVVPDVAADHRTAPQVKELQGWPPLGAAILLPLRTTEGVEGVLFLTWSPDHAHLFRQVDVQLPARFAEQVGFALQVARGRADQQRLVVFEDRDRIGRDLHDLVIQRLFAIGLGLENTARMMSDRPDLSERVAAAVDDLDATIKDIRRSIFALSVAEESTDVRKAVLELADRAARTLKFRPTVEFEGPVGSTISPDVAGHVTAVLAEALSNVAKHARASRVQVRLVAADGISLTVEDDGQGIPENATRGGLRNMAERAASLGGSCTVESRAQEGTSVVWSVPTQ